MKRIAALVPNVLGVSPGQRVRIESWAPYLREAGWEVDFYPFEDDRLHEVLYESGRSFTKAARLLSCYLRQLRRVVRGLPCDVLFLSREASLIGPAILERLAARAGTPIIYDLDDPVFVPYRSPMNGLFSLLKFSHKTHSLFRLSDHIITINDLIAEYAVRYNPSVSVIPNCVDVDSYRQTSKLPDSPIRLVWMGSHSTMSNLEAIAEPLRRLQSEHTAPLIVIGSGRVEIPGVKVDVRKWSAETEIADLQVGDIGLVPLPDLPWNHWKFFYKTVQYMALGIPVVARRMGSNSEIVDDGVNGFLVETNEEWYQRLAMLVTDSELRQRMGKAARSTIVKRFSTQVQMPRMVSIFEQVSKRASAVRN